MRILHATEIAQAGVATHLNTLVPLQARRHGSGNVAVYLPAEHLKNLTDELRRAARTETYVRGGRNLPALLRFAVGLVCLVRASRPDVVHFHSTFAGALGRLCRPFFPRATRLVYCPHGWAFYREDSALQRWFYRRVESALSYVSDAWVPVAYHEHAAGIAAGLCASRAAVVRYGLEDAGEPAVVQGLWPADRINLLFVGRFDRQKGLDVLFEAYAKAASPHLHLYIAGANVLDAPGATAALPTGVTLLGWCNAEQLLRYYAECDAVVIPSRWEGLPFVGLETLRAGRAILGSTRCSVPELVEEGSNGNLFALEDIDGIVALFRGLDKSRLRQFGRRSRALYLEQFQADRMLVEMEALYARICSDSQSGAASQ